MGTYSSCSPRLPLPRLPPYTFYMPEQRLTVRGILWENGRVFTARRALTKRFHPGIYELPGGWVEIGKQFEEALKREFKEECEIDIQVLDLAHASTVMLEDKHLGEIFFFVGQKDPTQPITLHAEDHSEIHWWSPEEFAQEWHTDHPDYCAIKKAFEIKMK